MAQCGCRTLMPARPRPRAAERRGQSPRRSPLAYAYRRPLIVVPIAITDKQDAIDPSALIVGNIQRAIGAYCDTHRPMFRRRRQRTGRAGETIGERLGATGRHPISTEGNELYLETLVRLRRSIESAVEGHERAATIALRELLPIVEEHSIRGPV